MLDQAAITEFKELYLKEYGVQLTDQQAMEYGIRLVQLVKAVCGKDLSEPRDVDNDKSKEHD